MRKTTTIFAAMLAAGLATGAAAQSNPIDRVSNPDALEYSDVEISPREMNPPFVRHGLVVEPQRLIAVKAGVAEADVQAALGAPLKTSGAGGREWDYDVKLKMPQSENYLVCQYKVVFSTQKLVSATVWRRRQCEDIARQLPAT